MPLLDKCRAENNYTGFHCLTLVKSSRGCDLLVIQANFDLWLHLRLRIEVIMILFVESNKDDVMYKCIVLYKILVVLRGS